MDALEHRPGKVPTKTPFSGRRAARRVMSRVAKKELR